MLSECLRGAEGLTGCLEGAEGLHEGCKGMLGGCMRSSMGCSGAALTNADMLVLQGQFDHSCATEGHLQQNLMILHLWLCYVTPDANLAQAMAAVRWTWIEPRGSDAVRSFVKATASSRVVGWTGSSLYCSWCSTRGSSISFCRTSSCSHHHTL